MPPTSTYESMFPREGVLMGAIAEAFRTGGIWMYALLGTGILTFFWLSIQTVLGLIGKRLPAVFWWLGPCLVAAIGTLGTAFGLSEALAALDHASPENKLQLLAFGFSLALNTVTFAALLNVLNGIAIAFGAGLSNAMGAESESDWSLGSPIVGGVLTLMVAGGVGAWTATSSIGTSAWPIPLTVLIGGIGIVLSGLRSGGADDKSAQLRASDRMTATSGAIFGVVAAGLSSLALQTIHVFRALEDVDPGQRAEAFRAGLETLGQTGLLGGIGVGGLVLVGGVVVIGAGRDLVSKHVLIDAVTCLVAFLPVLGAVGYGATTVRTFVSTFEQKLSDDRGSERGGDDSDDSENGGDAPGGLELERK
jgi:hypothetical protein